MTSVSRSPAHLQRVRSLALGFERQLGKDIEVRSAGESTLFVLIFFTSSCVVAALHGDSSFSLSSVRSQVFKSHRHCARRGEREQQAGASSVLNRVTRASVCFSQRHLDRATRREPRRRGFGWHNARRSLEFESTAAYCDHRSPRRCLR